MSVEILPTDESLNKEIDDLAKQGKSMRWRRFKVIKDGSFGVQRHIWKTEPGQGCPFGPWWSEEKMNSFGQTWKI